MRTVLYILLAWLAFVEPANAQQGASITAKRVALLVGQSRYSALSDPSVASVANVERDLALLAAAFQRAGFTTEIAKDLPSEALRNRLRAFSQTTKGAEAAVVYYTGVGIEVGGINYVAGTDLALPDTMPDDLEMIGFVPIQDLAVSVQSASQLAMVFAEAGRDTPWRAGASRGFKIARKISVSEAASDAGVLIFYGSRSGSSSQDGPSGGNGPFAAAVAKYLVEPDLEVGLFVRRVRAEVARATGGDQRPELFGELSEREFYFVGSSAPRATPPLEPVFSAQTRLALVIGNSDYNGDGDLDDGYESAAVLEEGYPADLTNPVNDSLDVAAALEKLKFKVMLVQNVDRSKLASALFKFEEAIKAAPDNAIVVVYYAGHAIQVGGANYLLPVGAKLPDQDLERLPLAQAELLISAEAVTVQTDLLGRLSDPKRDGLNLVILDACRENPWGGLMLTRGVGGRGGSGSQSRFRGLGEVRIDLRRTAIAYATKPGDVAADGQGRNSPYTAALVKQLPVSGVSVLDLLDRVNSEVEASTGGRQVPWVNSPAMGKSCLGACTPRG